MFFTFDTNREKIDGEFTWLYPFLKVLVTIKNKELLVTWFVFNKRIFSHSINRKLKSNKNGIFHIKKVIRIVAPQNVKINFYYGFQEPFLTGVACGVANIISQFIKISSFKHQPDFIASNDYIYMDAVANVNIGLAFLNMYKER